MSGLQIRSKHLSQYLFVPELLPILVYIARRHNSYKKCGRDKIESTGCLAVPTLALTPQLIQNSVLMKESSQKVPATTNGPMRSYAVIFAKLQEASELPEASNW